MHTHEKSDFDVARKSKFAFSHHHHHPSLENKATIKEYAKQEKIIVKKKRFSENGLQSQIVWMKNTSKTKETAECFPSAINYAIFFHSISICIESDCDNG